jgi:hypothetical protein
MEPRHDDQLSARRDSIQCRREHSVDLKGRLGRTFEGLTRRIPTVAKDRTDDPDWCHFDLRSHGLIFSPAASACAVSSPH